MGEVKRHLSEHDVAQLLVCRKEPRLLLLERRDSVGRPWLIRALLDAPLHRRVLLRTEMGHSRREHQAADALGMFRGVRLRDHAAVRVTEQEHLLQAQVIPQLLEVGDVVVDLVGA